MKIQVKQKKLSWHFKYDICINSDESQTFYFGIVKRNLLPGMHRIYLFDSNKKIVGMLREVNWLLKILSFIPLLPIYCPYKIEVDGKHSGTISRGIFNYARTLAKSNFLSDSFQICNDTDFKFFIDRNVEQIGEIRRDNYSEMNARNYEADFDYDSNPIFNSLIILYIDFCCLERQYINTTFYTKKWEYEINLFPSKNRERKNWRPKTKEYV